MRHVKHDRLRAFEQHTFSLCHALRKIAGIRYDVVADQRPRSAHGFECDGIHRGPIARGSQRHLPENGLAVVHQVAQLERRAVAAAGP
ncbi:hypothetical protein D3C72_1918920 [compost metagenome]